MAYTTTVITAIASALDARTRCLSGTHCGRVMDGDRDVTDQHWAEMATTWRDRAEAITREYLPSGSGIDHGTTLDLDASREDRIVFTTAFHHMDDGGGYAGWTDHVVTVRPSLIHGITIQISGRNRNDIKDYLHDVFHTALTAEITVGPIALPTTAREEN